MPISRVTVRKMADAIVKQELGLPLEEWVVQQRASNASWDTLADTLSDATDVIVDISGKTLSRWFDTLTEAAA